MKAKEYQVFKSLDVMSVFALFGAVLAVVGHIFWSNIGDKSGEFALKDMESLSGQILAGGLNALPSNNDMRSVASVPALKIDKMGSEGKIGKDPWGQAFHYRVLQGSKLNYVVVISGGPDKSIQTDYTEIELGPAGHLMGTKLVEDDVWYIRKVKR